jgi:hypothetical protein
MHVTSKFQSQIISQIKGKNEPYFIFSIRIITLKSKAARVHSFPSDMLYKTITISVIGVKQYWLMRLSPEFSSVIVLRQKN